MTIAFYALSGSPFTWKVWLALEHKQIPYDFRLLSNDAGDLKEPWFLEINPRGKVPVIVDDGVIIRESSVIVDYLEESRRESGEPLWPAEPKMRAHARQVAEEVDWFLYPHVRRLVVELLGGEPDSASVLETRSAVERELAVYAASLGGDFMAGDKPTAADFALYPLTAIVRRLAGKAPDYGLGEVLPSGIRGWMGRIESLPYFAKTYPPHWAAQERAAS